MRSWKASPALWVWAACYCTDAERTSATRQDTSHVWSCMYSCNAMQRSSSSSKGWEEHGRPEPRLMSRAIQVVLTCTGTRSERATDRIRKVQTLWRREEAPGGARAVGGRHRVEQPGPVVAMPCFGLVWFGWLVHTRSRQPARWLSLSPRHALGVGLAAVGVPRQRGGARQPPPRPQPTAVATAACRCRRTHATPGGRADGPCCTPIAARPSPSLHCQPSLPGDPPGQLAGR